MRNRAPPQRGTIRKTTAKRLAAVTAAAIAMTGAASSAMAHASEFVDYTTTDRAGVVLQRPEDSVKLKGATEGFQAYMHDQVADLTAHSSPGCPTSMNVTGADERFAAGGVNDCGGAVQLWSVGGDGDWHPLWAGQTLTPCSTLRSAHFSPEVYRTTGSDKCSEGTAQVVYRG